MDFCNNSQCWKKTYYSVKNNAENKQLKKYNKEHLALDKKYVMKRNIFLSLTIILCVLAILDMILIGVFGQDTLHELRNKDVLRVLYGMTISLFLLDILMFIILMAIVTKKRTNIKGKKHNKIVLTKKDITLIDCHDYTEMKHVAHDFGSMIDDYNVNELKTGYVIITIPLEDISSYAYNKNTGVFVVNQKGQSPQGIVFVSESEIEDLKNELEQNNIHSSRYI